MLFIESLVYDLAPQVVGNKGISIASITTTNPVYLIFLDDAVSPDLVVRLSDSDQIQKTHGLLVDVFNTVGNLVPEPILTTRYKGQYVAIQKGLSGLPWFQLTKSYSNPDKWHELKTRAIDTLQMFHQALKADSKWTLTCSPANELRNSHQKCIDLGLSLPENTGLLVDSLQPKLEKLDGITGYSQHGDFCLNNLIISEKTIQIIDFEDFGITSIPLYDHFTLALSLFQLAPKTISSSLQHEISLCTSSAAKQLGFDESTIDALFLYHLLLRLGEWSQLNNRKEYNRWLHSILIEFVADKKAYIK